MSTEERFDRRVERLVERYEGRVDYEAMELVLQQYAQTVRARRDAAIEAKETPEEHEQDT